MKDRLFEDGKFVSSVMCKLMWNLEQLCYIAIAAFLFFTAKTFYCFYFLLEVTPIILVLSESTYNSWE